MAQASPNRPASATIAALAMLALLLLSAAGIVAWVMTSMAIESMGRAGVEAALGQILPAFVGGAALSIAPAGVILVIVRQFWPAILLTAFAIALVIAVCASALAAYGLPAADIARQLGMTAAAMAALPVLLYPLIFILREGLVKPTLMATGLLGEMLSAVEHAGGRRWGKPLALLAAAGLVLAASALVVGQLRR